MYLSARNHVGFYGLHSERVPRRLEVESRQLLLQFDLDSTVWVLNIRRTFDLMLIVIIALLDFETPRGIKLHVSSLPSPNFATSYTIANSGIVDGSLSYLYTSLPLHKPSKSTHIPLRDVIRGYRHLDSLQPTENAWEWEIWQGGRRIDRRDTLMYGRIFLPQRRLEALYMRRLSPTKLVKISAVSDDTLPNGGTILGEFKSDNGKYSTEYLYSTDSALLGFRGLYNFGPDPRERSLKSKDVPIICGPSSIPTSTSTTVLSSTINNSEQSQQFHTPPSLFSLGTEIYYGLLNSTVGISTGLRFTTLPPTYGSHTSFPYTMTLTLNPLMGNLSSTYSVKAGENIALCSRFDFNFYSYESGVLVGAELWRMKRKMIIGEEEWAKRMIRPEWLPATQTDSTALDSDGELNRGATHTVTSGIKPSAEISDEDVAGVLKARVDQNWKIGLLWEGRFKELLYSVGTSLDLKRREQIFRGLGIEISYSS